MLARPATADWPRREEPLTSVLKNAKGALGRDQAKSVDKALEAVHGQVPRLSNDANGCVLVQDLLDRAQIPGQKAMAAELVGHVAQLLGSQHGNFVLQKAIEVMPPKSISFMLDELEQWGPPQKLARDKFGCRVLERLIEHIPLEEATFHRGTMERWIADIIGNAADLGRHEFGNFVLQHLLEHGTDVHRSEIALVLLRMDIRDVATQQNLCLVFNKALTYASRCDQEALAERVISTPGVLVDMACQRNAFSATIRLFKVVSGPLLELARAQLARDEGLIRGTKHGRSLLETLAGRNSGVELP